MADGDSNSSSSSNLTERPADQAATGSQNSSSNLTERLRAGRQIHRAEHKAGDAKKLGNLRAGNSGIMSETGEIAGSCARLAHLRAIGVETEVPDDSKLIMFQMGIANEDVVYNDIILTSAEDEIILRETEIPTSWRTAGGVLVTGRPDMVICRACTVDETGARLLNPEVASKYGTEYVRPVWGVELKSIASVWTTREVLFLGSPKLGHLVQAGHYSMELDCPFTLCYKQYGNQVVPSWAARSFPKKGQPNSEFISYADNGDIKSTIPFEVAYELEFSKSGYLRYRRQVPTGTEPTPWTKTLISRDDLRRFYEFAGEMPVTGDLGSKPLGIDALGNEKSTGPCTYCSLAKICRAAEKENKKAEKAQSELSADVQREQRLIRYREWLEKVRAHLAEIHGNS